PPPTPTPLSPLSLHDALPIFFSLPIPLKQAYPRTKVQPGRIRTAVNSARSSRHTKCLQHLTTLLARMQLSKIVSRNRSTASVPQDRKSTRLNSSHVKISYAVF